MNHFFKFIIILGFSSTTGSSSSFVGSSFLIGSTGSFVILVLGLAFDLASGFALTGGSTSSSIIVSIAAS